MVGDGVTKEGKKTRGRPRVDTHDATAADVSDSHVSVRWSPASNLEQERIVLLLVMLQAI